MDPNASTSALCPPTGHAEFRKREVCRSVSDTSHSLAESDDICTIEDRPRVNPDEVEAENGSSLYDEDDDDDEDEDEIDGDGTLELKNKPKGTNWRQQRMEAWEPILTPFTVLPSFLLFGLIMVPIGVILLETSDSIQEFSYDYTDCERTCNPKEDSCYCVINFELKEDFGPDVYLYYVLKHYYQSNRRYAGSWDAKQIRGIYYENVHPACCPYDFEKNGSTHRPIAPCGIVANSMFNDTFVINPCDKVSSDRVPVIIKRSEIAWATDRAFKFRNPEDSSLWTEKWAKPPNWEVTADKLDPDHPENNGFLNEAFLVWMRVGAFTTTRKLYGRVFSDKNSDTNYTEGLLAGNYTLKVNYNYPVSSFGGRKVFLLSTTSWFGGKSSFLGVAYIVVGSLVLVLTLFLFAIYQIYGQR